MALMRGLDGGGRPSPCSPTCGPRGVDPTICSSAMTLTSSAGRSHPYHHTHPLPLSHCSTHTHAHARARALSHTHALTCTHTARALFHTHMLSLAHTHCKHVHGTTRVCARAHTFSHMRTPPLPLSACRLQDWSMGDGFPPLILC